MTVEAGAPNLSRKGYDELVRVASESPGQWFSCPISGPRTAAYPSIYHRIAAVVAEVEISNGRIYLRMKP